MNKNLKLANLNEIKNTYKNIKDIDKEYYKKYDFLKPEGGLMNSLMYFGIEVGLGWFRILDTVFVEIQKVIDKDTTGYLKNNFKFIQIKEKFGTLRLYTNITTKEISEIIDWGENISEKVCEVCGEKGELCEIRGWYVTLCEKHKNEVLNGKTIGELIRESKSL